MWERDCGFVPVTNEYGQIAGVITDRDICMAAYTQGKPLGTIRTDSAMARLVYFGRPSMTVGSIEAMMQHRQIRRVPIVDDQERVIGVLSLADLARYCVDMHGSPASLAEVTFDSLAATLAGICRAHPEPSGPPAFRLPRSSASGSSAVPLVN